MKKYEKKYLICITERKKSEEVMQQKWVVEILNNYQERKLDTDCRISKKMIAGKYSTNIF